jgi:hypothetical protein
MADTALAPICLSHLQRLAGGALQEEFAPFPRSYYRRAVLKLWQDFATYARGKCEQTKPAVGLKSARNPQKAYPEDNTFPASAVIVAAQ